MISNLTFTDPNNTVGPEDVIVALFDCSAEDIANESSWLKCIRDSHTSIADGTNLKAAFDGSFSGVVHGVGSLVLVNPLAAEVALTSIGVDITFVVPT